MKHKVIIMLNAQGHVNGVHVSGDTDIVLDNPVVGIFKLEPDSIFETGEGHKYFTGKKAEKVKKWGI